MNMYNIELLHFMLNESRGVVDNYNEIGEETYNKLNATDAKLIDSKNGLYLRMLSNIKIEFDCFIDNISIMYYSYKNGKNDSDGKFIPYENDNENLSNNKKLINSKIVLYEKTDTPEKIDKYHFMTVFSHEIAHAYRYYSILSQNNSNIPDSVKKENDVYLSTLKKNDISNEKIKNFISGIIYLIDKDEMTAFSNETYEQLRQNKQINRNNVQDHFNDFRMYRNITLLKMYLSNFDASIKDEKILNGFKDALNKIYNTNYTNYKGIKMFRQKIVKEITKMSSQFIKIIEKGLMDFNRYSEFYREHFSEKELNLIAESFKI